MKNTFLPLLTATSVIFGRATTFHTNDEKVIVEAPNRLVRQLAALCDGTRTSKEVIQHLEKEWDSKAVRGLLNALRRKKLIVDSRQIGEEAWKVVENPSRFPNRITDADAVRLAHKADDRHRCNPTEIVYPTQVDSLGSLLVQRQSVRSFSGAVIELQSVIDMLWSAYGTLKPQKDVYLRRTVPSAGALYPLFVHVVLFKKTGDLQPAIYSVYLGSSESVGFRFVSDDLLQFSRAFLNPLMLEKAHGVIVISGSFRVTGEKYGNRSML